MPRLAKKADDKAKIPPVVAAPAPTMVPPPPAAGVMPVPLPSMPVAAHVPIPATRVVDTDSFMRVRDSAIGRLTTILELLRSFTADYIRQTNLLMGEPTADLAQGDMLSSFENAAAQLMMPVPEIVAPVEEKERKKRTHDPNAPKRPLTPYFLYMQHARSIISNDLGADAPKGAVQEEGQRRWANMSPTEKKGWNAAYQYNLRLYNARVHSYKAGNPLAKNMSDEEALKYADDFQVPMPEMKYVPSEIPANENDAIAEQLQQQQQHHHQLHQHHHQQQQQQQQQHQQQQQQQQQQQHQPQHHHHHHHQHLQLQQPPLPPLPHQVVDAEATKTPKKASSSGRKRKAATPAPEPVPMAAEVAKAAPNSPDKKRRRASTKLNEDKEEPKKSSRKKAKNS